MNIHLACKIVHIKARIARNSKLLRKFLTQRWTILDVRWIFMN